MIRNYGITGLQEHIRKSVFLAEKFENFVRNDPRFEIPAKRYLGLVVFRLVGENFITETLCKRWLQFKVLRDTLKVQFLG